jgi:hypothetical protein
LYGFGFLRVGILGIDNFTNSVLLGLIDLKHQIANPFPPNKRRGKKGGCRVPQVNKEDDDAPAV